MLKSIPRSAGGNHCDPRCEISVVHVDVFGARSLDQERVVDSKPGVQKRAQPPPKGLASLKKCATEEIFEQRKFQNAQESGVD